MNRYFRVINNFCTLIDAVRFAFIQRIVIIIHRVQDIALFLFAQKYENMLIRCERLNVSQRKTQCNGEIKVSSLVQIGYNSAPQAVSRNFPPHAYSFDYNICTRNLSLLPKQSYPSICTIKIHPYLSQNRDDQAEAITISPKQEGSSKYFEVYL